MTLPMGRAMREIFGETVADLAGHDPRVVMLDGDVGSSTKGDIFEKAHPDRYLQMGIAEQNMMGVAAGLATMGLIPLHQHVRLVRRGPAARPDPRPHRPDRAQRQDHARLRRAVHGQDRQEPHQRGRRRDHAGDAGHGDVSPADDVEAARSSVGPPPTRVRSTSASSGTPPSACSARTTRSSSARRSRSAREATSRSSARAPDAAGRRCGRAAGGRGIDAHVLHVPTIKPIDVDAIVAAADQTGLVITVEEHTIIGGLGGAVAETLASTSRRASTGSGCGTATRNPVRTTSSSTSTASPPDASPSR